MKGTKVRHPFHVTGGAPGFKPNLTHFSTLPTRKLSFFLILTFCCCLLQSVGANEEKVKHIGRQQSVSIGSRNLAKGAYTQGSKRSSLIDRQPTVPNSPQQSPTVIVKITYRIDTGPVIDATEQDNVLRNQRSVRVGDRFSRHAIQQSVKALYATQQYSQIQVYAQETPDGVALTFQLTPFALIKKITLTGVPANEFSRAIKNAIKSKQGGKYVPAIVSTDIHRIKRICEAYGYFDAKVAAPEALTPEGTLTYHITLGEGTIIKRLHIQGNTALSTNSLKADCSFSRLSPVYNRFAVDNDVAAMHELYYKNNYPTATVAPTFFPETGRLQFHINEGKQIQFHFILDVGELSKSRQDTFRENIITRINTAHNPLWERRIKSYFEEQGYHDTTVHQKVLDEASVRLTINPGTRYKVTRVTFSGNRMFSDAELLREMTMKPVGRFWQNVGSIFARLLFGRKQRHFFYQQALDDDVRRFKILYARAGYPNAAIEATLHKQKSSKRNIGDVIIHVSVTEHRKEMIHRCRIRGNHALDTDTLLTRVQSELPLPQPNASFKRAEYQDAVLKAYYELGYIDAKVNGTYIAETPVFRVTGDFSETLADGKLPRDIRDEFKKHNLTLTRVFIATNVGNRWSIQDAEGNPRYTLKQEATHLEVFEHGILELTVETEGEQVKFGKFYFQGDTDVVKQHVLQREVEPLEGTLWTSEKLNRAWQSLYSLGLFHNVQIERRTEQKTNDVVIKIEKQKPRTYSLSSGYGSAEGFRGTLELTDRNFLFKRNLRGRIRGRLGWRDELGYLFDATLTEPWLIRRTRASLQASARKLEVDDNVRALQASFILSRDLSKSHRLDLRYSYRDLNQPVPLMQETPVGMHAPEGLDPFSTTVSSVRFSWTYDSRVRYLNRTSGMLNALTLEYAGGFLQGETSFIKTTTDTRYYQKLVGELVLATAVRLGITTGLRSNRRAELISFERFWAGGSTTVRGYAERSLGPEDITGIHRGDVQFIFNTELRFPIYSLVRGALFFDIGNVWGSLEDIERTIRLPSSVGAGLYLDLGALTGGIDYAIPLVPAPNTRNYHIRLSSTF